MIDINPQNPQKRLIAHITELLKNDGIIALPTDARYVLACAVDSASAQQHLRLIRHLPDNHLFSLLCQDLSQVAEYAVVDNEAFRIVKQCFPGAYTIILQGTKNIGRKICHPQRKTLGIRIPDHRVVQAILENLGKPMVATTLQNDEGEDFDSAHRIAESFTHPLAAIINTEETHHFDTTVLDLTQNPYVCLRAGVSPIPW